MHGCGHKAGVVKVQALAASQRPADVAAIHAEVVGHGAHGAFGLTGPVQRRAWIEQVSVPCQPGAIIALARACSGMKSLPARGVAGRTLSGLIWPHEGAHPSRSLRRRRASHNAEQGPKRDQSRLSKAALEKVRRFDASEGELHVPRVRVLDVRNSIWGTGGRAAARGLP